MVGETVRRQLFDDAPAVGEQIRAGNAWFTVIGVLAAKGTSPTGQDQDDTTMLAWTTARERLLGKDIGWLDDILCSAVSPEMIKDAGRQISELLRERHHIEPGRDDDFYIRHPEELLQARVKSSQTLRSLFLIIASISMLVGGIGVMNVMLASVSQRVAEIGLRAAVGATPAAIRVQLLAEAILLTTIGGALGVLLGEIAGRTLQNNLGLTLAMSPVLSGSAVLAAITAGIAFGYYPARQAAQLDPIDALGRS
ncbi:hypothetical protein BH11MYX3_BH11MYX3_42480 [soil metagenome]